MLKLDVCILREQREWVDVQRLHTHYFYSVFLFVFFTDSFLCRHLNCLLWVHEPYYRGLECQHEDFRGSRWIEQLDGDLLTGRSLIYLMLEILKWTLNIWKLLEDTFSQDQG